MEIIQMYYFYHIVDNNFNLSLTAKRLHISQPALSQFINQYEEANAIDLFVREKGRLVGLTDAGKKVYDFAVQITNMYEQMEDAIKQESLKQKGGIRFGLPSLILRVYFSELFPKMIQDNVGMNLQLVEDGSNQLREQLNRENLDIGILIEPTDLDDEKYEQTIIQIDEMAAFMSANHPLNNVEKLEWSDLQGYPLATFNEDYITYSLLWNKLEQVGLTNQIRFTASAWDYLIEMTKETNIVTILPRPISKHLVEEDFVVKPFYDAIPFNFYLCRPRKKRYSGLEASIYEQILAYFYQINEQ
ncbi:LysR family transcriptional regulator [Aerococcaceae bacterium DSM 111020]|nr:LysR family transcriptional regulator [Aerococcaceae bacterium DSM 111020]